MSNIGEPVYPEDSNEGVGEDMMYLMSLIEAPAGSQEGPGGRRVPVAPAYASQEGLGLSLIHISEPTRLALI
eukprot:3530380-Alexandrium_andersonii.AAC.1